MLAVAQQTRGWIIRIPNRYGESTARGESQRTKVAESRYIAGRQALKVAKIIGKPLFGT